MCPPPCKKYIDKFMMYIYHKADQKLKVTNKIVLPCLNIQRIRLVRYTVRSAWVSELGSSDLQIHIIIISLNCGGIQLLKIKKISIKDDLQFKTRVTSTKQMKCCIEFNVHSCSRICSPCHMCFMRSLQLILYAKV